MSALCIFLLIFTFTSQVALNPDAIGITVDIPDANLESALQSKLGIPSDPLTDSDLAKVNLSVIDRQSGGIGVLQELGAS